MSAPTIPTPRKRGQRRPGRYQATGLLRAKVRSLSGYGVPQADIARLIDTDGETLRRHYRDDLDLGTATALANISGKCYRQANDGNTTAIIFWLKARAGWTDNANQRELDAKLTAIQAKLDALSATKAGAT